MTASRIDVLNPRREVCNLLPPPFPERLMAAVCAPSSFETARLIDEITDELAKAGLVRPRSAWGEFEPAWKKRAQGIGS